MKDIFQNKLKQFIIIFGKTLGAILVIILMAVFAVIPIAITESPYFIISWIIFIIALYTTISICLFVQVDKNK